jgi:hypothetical protein
MQPEGGSPPHRSTTEAASTERRNHPAAENPQVQQRAKQEGGFPCHPCPVLRSGVAQRPSAAVTGGYRMHKGPARSIAEHSPNR